MKRHMLFLAAVAVAPAAVAHAQQNAFDPAPFVDEAITKVKAMAFRTKDVDWPTLEAAVRKASEGAKDQVDLLPAYRLLVEGLGDNHSFVQPSDEDRALYKARYGSEFDASRPFKKPTSAFTARRQPEERALRIGRNQAHLVTVPTMGGGGARATAYADKLYGYIMNAAPSSCGYVVDLRGNQGGNVWPMVAGLSALLGDGWRSNEISRDGRRSSYARLEKGAAIVNEGEQKDLRIVEVAAWKPDPRLANAPVAVLIDDAIGSSGEGTTIALKGRANTRFFGQNTYALASSNEGVMIADRVNLVVTTEMMADRNGVMYPAGVKPDEAVPFGEGSAADPDDAVVEAAKAWLARQPACRAK